MEVSVPDLAGSLGGGGRYDGLIGTFSGEQIPACGFSLGLERILVVMQERKMFPAEVQTSGPDVFVTIFSEGLERSSIALATQMREGNLRVEIYPEASRTRNDFSKQLKYATARNSRYVAIMDQQDETLQQVRVRNLETGEQMTLATNAVTGYIQARRASRLAPRASDLDHRSSENE
jgi:histidyl-tRNA synthetase